LYKAACLHDADSAALTLLQALAQYLAGHSVMQCDAVSGSAAIMILMSLHVDDTNPNNTSRAASHILHLYTLLRGLTHILGLLPDYCCT